jgi:D-sedoheptulose 7-phosphate isomerase
MTEPGDTLESFYPFLHGAETDPDGENAALFESILHKARQSIEVKRAFFEANGERLIEAARAIAEVYRRDGRLFTMGNGGSACDAAHVAVEFLHPITAGRPALPAINLTADPAMLTAIGNDVGFAHVFVRELIAQARPGDGLIGISTSGNSSNLLAAFARAKEIGLTTIGLSGGDGGLMARSPDVDVCLTVMTDSVHRVQETHLAAYHIIWDLVHTMLAQTRGRGAALR